MDHKEPQPRRVNAGENDEQPESRLAAQARPARPETEQSEGSADVMEALDQLGKDRARAGCQALPRTAVLRDDGAPDGSDDGAASIALMRGNFARLEQSLDTRLV